MRRAVLDADSAADAALGDDARLFASVLFNHFDCVDWAYLHALAAADALFRVYPRYEVRAYRLRDAEALDREHRLAAAGAAVADEVHAAADVFAELHEVIVVRLRQEVAALGRVDLTAWPYLMSVAAVVLKVMQMSIGASQACPSCIALWRQ